MCHLVTILPDCGHTRDPKTKLCSKAIAKEVECGTFDNPQVETNSGVCDDCEQVNQDYIIEKLFEEANSVKQECYKAVLKAGEVHTGEDYHMLLKLFEEKSKDFDAMLARSKREMESGQATTKVLREKLASLEEKIRELKEREREG
ncbi:hypothetical protein EYC80_002130 [Monilinia laxa]|uniref:Uncharacterized protein n=1 Tax=Monilinia laxa TaxID=61186 RepID=A0A5N6K305_MONLA|nr:hypothetical protein EYC80_002130 [Monilinia laxa]